MSLAIPATPVAVSRPGRGRTGHSLFRRRELSATTILIAVVGEVDASNSGDLLRYVEEKVGGYRQLVLDLSGLRFFGIDGFSALHTVDVHCARRHIDWVLVPGQEVTRVLRVCDPDGVLTTAGNIVSAVAVLVRGRHTQLHLTPLTD